MGDIGHVVVGVSRSYRSHHLSLRRPPRRGFALVLACAIVLSSLTALMLSVDQRANAPIPLKARILYTSHDPIYITSDGDWATSGFPGDGTEGNPYVVSGYDITGVGSDAINIQGTTVHFVIEDCYLHGDGYGIYLYNAENATLTDNNCSGNANDGISVSGSNGNVSLDLTGNIVLNNGGYGINAYSWPGDLTAVIVGCNVSGNSYGGIYLEGGNNLFLTMSGTNVSFSGGYGIEMWSDNWDINAELIGCRVDNSSDNGMYIESSNNLNLTLTDTAVVWNYGSGIEAYSDIGDVIADVDGCDFDYNGWTGFYLYAQGGLELTMDGSNSSWNSQSGGWSAGLEMYSYDGDLYAEVNGCNMSYNGNEGVFARGSYDTNLTLVDCVVTYNDQVYGWSCGVEAYAYDGDLNLTMISSQISDQYDEGVYMEAGNNLYLNLDSTSIVRNRDGDYGGYGIEGYTYYGEVVAVMDGCNISESYDDGMYFESSSNIVLDLTDTIVASNDGYGIDAYSYDGAIYADLEFCNVSSNYYSGLYLSCAYEIILTMVGCDASWNGLEGYSGYGVEAYNGDYTQATINGCRINGNYFDGLYLSGLDSSAITDSVFSYNGGQGMNVAGFDYGTISDNICMFNGDNGIGVYYSTGSDIGHNICRNNSGDGIEVTWSNGCTVSWNFLSGNYGYGIGLYSSSGCTVWNNTLMFNRGSTTVWDPGLVQGYDDGGNAWNVDGTPHGWGNFWSDWTTPDDDADGIVDISYELDGGMAVEDLYPLTEAQYRLPKVVFGIVRGEDGNPLPGAGVTVTMKDGATVAATKAAQTDTSGSYGVIFAWDEWNVSYAIDVTATSGGSQAFNSSVADVNSSQEIDVMFEYEIPDFGSFYGFLVAGLFIGIIGAILLARGKGKRK